MDQSLDSIIKSKKQEKRTSRPATSGGGRKTFKSGGSGSGSGGGGGGRGKVAVTGAGAGARAGGLGAAASAAAGQRKVVVAAQRPHKEQRGRDNRDNRDRDRERPKSAGASIFDRLGGPGGSSGAQASGTKVEIRGLTKAVTKADVTQLCESIGEVKSVHKKFDTAEVVFERRSHALSAIKKFHGLTLDGVPMAVTLAGDRGRSNPFDPNDSGSQEDRDSGRRGNGKSNVREGFFGTRGGDATDNSSGINFGYKKPASTHDQKITVTIK
jgi:THO complex subunit 4